MGSPMRIASCRAGHLWSTQNTRWHKRADGRSYRQCRQCAARRGRLRYRNDDAWREKEKARCLGFYYSKQMEQRT
jgi:hypothetical protein